MFKNSVGGVGSSYKNSEEGSFGVLNFRDLGLSSAENVDNKKYVKEGLLFRSATLDNMDQESVDAFIKAHKINTILDLRTGFEGREGLPIDKSFPTTTLAAMSPSTLIGDDADLKVKKEEKFETTGNSTLVRKKIRVDFVGKNFQRNCIFAACPLSLKLQVIYLMTFCQRKKATYLIAKRVMAPMGVNRMYKEFANYCKDEIKSALMVFTDPANYPIEIHCTQGKDRTGIVSALLLSMAGVPEDIIVNDYAKTQKALQPIYKEMMEEVLQSGLTEDFAQAPPQYMRDFLEHLKEDYGSVNGFLDAIGFDENLREKVRRIISI